MTPCFVGVAFFDSLDRSTLSTSSAQVFNGRGDGVVVRGATAAISKDDRQPHLREDDAETLVVEALRRYREEHKGSPYDREIMLEPVERVEVTIVVDNFVYVLMADAEGVERERLRNFDPADQLIAEHGFSARVTVHEGGRQSSVLYDAGLTPGGLGRNLDVLQIPVRDLRAIVISHEHADHSFSGDSCAQAASRSFGNTGLDRSNRFDWCFESPDDNPPHSDTLPTSHANVVRTQARPRASSRGLLRVVRSSRFAGLSWSRRPWRARASRLRTSMVRRGSPVRVRKRAWHNKAV